MDTALGRTRRMSREARVDWLMAWACPHGRFRARRSNCHVCIAEMLAEVEAEARVNALAECVRRVAGA